MRQLHAEGKLTGRLTAKLSDLEMAAMLHGGETLEEIGKKAGLTRERVRQRLKRIGVKPARRVDVLKILEVIRTAQVTTCEQVGKRVAVDGNTVQVALEELNVIDAVERLFRWRKHRQRLERQSQTVDAIQKYAAVLGHTPRAEDFIRRDRPRDVPSLGTVQKLFGTLTEAMNAAGLRPNVPGRYARN